MLFTGSGCNLDHRSKKDEGSSSSQTTTDKNSIKYLISSDIDYRNELSEGRYGYNVVSVSGDRENVEYSQYRFMKTGLKEESSETANSNAAISAENGASPTITNSLIITEGTEAFGILSYGIGTNVDISDSVITTRLDSSDGLLSASNGDINAVHVTVETQGNYSSAAYAETGGGVIIDRGSYTTLGKNSPVLHSAASISVMNARLTSKASQAVVIEGRNSAALENCEINANHNDRNSTDPLHFQAVLIYQPDNDSTVTGKSKFSSSGGTLTNSNGDIFFVTNTAADITLENTDIINEDTSGKFLRAEESIWGTSGNNGGKINLNANNQLIQGDIIVDNSSILNFYMTSDSAFSGALNRNNSEGKIYVEISSGSKWVLTGNSYITSLTCQTDSVNLNGYTLYVNGIPYVSGTSSSGNAIDFDSSGDSGLIEEEGKE